MSHSDILRSKVTLHFCAASLFERVIASTFRAMATEQSDIIQRAVDAALANIEKYAPQEFQQLEADPAKKKALIQAAREAAEETVKVAEEFRTRPSENVAERLSKHLPKHRVDLIRTGLQVPTYRLDISKRDDGHHWADITRDGKPFMESKQLNTLAAINETSWSQMASIIVEAVMLVLQAVGIKVSVSEQAILKIAETIIAVIEKNSQLQEAVKALQKAVESGSISDTAKAIFYLIEECYSAGILWEIIKELCGNMSYTDWAITIATVSASIIADFASGGAALIAEIVLALSTAKSAYDFYKKFTNLGELDALKREL